LENGLSKDFKLFTNIKKRIIVKLFNYPGRVWSSWSKTRPYRHYAGHTTELGSGQSQRAALNANAFGEAIARSEATHERLANAHDKATLAAKLTRIVKRRMNALLTCDEVALAVKLNAHDEAAYEHPATHAAKLCSNELTVNR